MQRLNERCNSIVSVAQHATVSAENRAVPRSL